MIFKYTLPNKTIMVDRTISKQENTVSVIGKDATGQLIKIKQDIQVDSFKRSYITIENETLYLDNFLAQTWDELKENFDKKEDLEIIKKDIFFTFVKYQDEVVLLCSLKRRAGLGREKYIISEISYNEHKNDYDIILIPQNTSLNAKDNEIIFTLTELAENLKGSLVKLF